MYVFLLEKSGGEMYIAFCYLGFLYLIEQAIYNDKFEAEENGAKNPGRYQ